MRTPSCILASLALVLGGCPAVVNCDPGFMWNGSMCVARTDGGLDTGMVDGGGDTGGDVPCGGCTLPLVCDTASGDCVECIGTDASTCSDAGDNACVASVCVACDSNDDCESLTAAQCNTITNSCEACTGDVACMARTGTEVCAAGECVECSAADETACGANVCNLLTSECETAVTPGSVALCGACTNDRACMTGQVCAPTEFPVGSGTEVGNFCLWRLDAAPGPAGSCLNTPPHRRTDSVTTVGGLMVDVCSPQVSTCEGLADFGGPTCTVRGAADPTCGLPGVDDGFCPATGDPLCTVECTNFRDCPCVTGACARQYECQSNRCSASRSCDTTTGTCG